MIDTNNIDLLIDDINLCVIDLMDDSELEELKKDLDNIN